MKPVLVDTSVWRYFFAGRATARRLATLLEEEGIVLMHMEYALLYAFVKLRHRVRSRPDRWVAWAFRDFDLRPPPDIHHRKAGQGRPATMHAADSTQHAT